MCYIHCTKDNCVSLELLSIEEVAIDGVVTKQSKFVLDDPVTRFDGMNASDFNLQNQLAAGVDLKSCICKPLSFEAVDSVVRGASRMFDYIERKVLKEKSETNIKND